MGRPPDFNPAAVLFLAALSLAAGCALLTAYIASIFWLCRAVWNLIV